MLSRRLFTIYPLIEMNQTGKTGLEAVVDGLLGLNRAVGESLSDLDRVEIQIVQEQLARIIHRNGLYVARQQDGAYMVDGAGGIYQPYSQREQLDRAIKELADLEGTNCYCDNCYCDNGHEQNGTSCLICFHTEVLKNPVSTDAEMITSVFNLVCRIAELEEDRKYGQQQCVKHKERPWTAFDRPKQKGQLLNISYR